MTKIAVEFSHEEIVGLMRSLLRSLPETPKNESALHQSLYSKLGDFHLKTLPPGLVKRVGKAIDGAIGR